LEGHEIFLADMGVGSKAGSRRWPSLRILPGTVLPRQFDAPTEGYTLLNADLASTFKLDGQADPAPEITFGLKAEYRGRHSSA
jgi:hypothetical protein